MEKTDLSALLKYYCNIDDLWMDKNVRKIDSGLRYVTGIIIDTRRKDQRLEQGLNLFNYYCCYHCQ